MPTLNAAELEAHLKASFPGGEPESWIFVEDVTDTTLRLRRRVDVTNMRPGGTVSGPTLMMVADTVAWLLTLAQLPPGSDAVTQELTIHFLRRPALADLIGDGRLLRIGRRAAVVDVSIRSDGSDDEVAHALVTYAPLSRRER